MALLLASRKPAAVVKTVRLVGVQLAAAAVRHDALRLLVDLAAGVDASVLVQEARPVAGVGAAAEVLGAAVIFVGLVRAVLDLASVGSAEAAVSGAVGGGKAAGSFAFFVLFAASLEQVGDAVFAVVFGAAVCGRHG